MQVKAPLNFATWTWNLRLKWKPNISIITQTIALRNTQHTDLDLQDELCRMNAIWGCKENFISESLRAVMTISVEKRFQSYTNFSQIKKNSCFLIMPYIVCPSLCKSVHLTLLILSQFLQRVLGVSYKKKTPKVNHSSVRKKTSLMICHLCSGCLWGV